MCDDCWTIQTIGDGGENDVITCRGLGFPCRCACHTAGEPAGD